MGYRYTLRDRWFMRKAHWMSVWYDILADQADRFGNQELYNKWTNKSFDWWERGWECSIGI